MYVRAMRIAGLVMWLGTVILHGQVRWMHPFGSSSWDDAQGVASDATGVYVVGLTWGALPGQTNAGVSDAFVSKYGPDGTELWTRQFGTSHTDYAYGVASDATGVYVVGYATGLLPGQTSAGDGTAFIRKYDPNGTELWTRQFGSSPNAAAYGVASDAAGVYVVGYTNGVLPGQTSAGGDDAFLRKYDPNGTELWTREFGSSNSDYGYGVASDATGVYVAGYTDGVLPGQTSAGGWDAFVRKYDPNGTEQWTRQFGTSDDDFAYGVARDATGVYVAGYTGQTSAGSDDAFVCKYDPNGTELWTRQFGSSTNDYAYGVASDATGVYVVGSTSGVLPGQSSAGGFDAFIRGYSPNGAELSTLQFGTPGLDSAYGVVGGQALYVVGGLGMSRANGGENAFVLRLR